MNKILSILSSFIVCLSFSHAVVAQKESLGAVKYTPPKGWTKTEKENVVTFSEINQAAGTFCLITLYGANSSSGSPETDFTGAWNNLVVKPWGAEANPETATEKAEGWTVIGGGSRIDFQGNKALAFLNVVSGFGKVVSVLTILNADSYVPQMRAFMEGMEVDKSVARIESPAAPSQLSTNVATMHAAALVKEFESNEIHALETYGGKRVRIKGTVNSIEIDRAGRIVLTFKSSITTYGNARCYFPKSQSSRVGALKAHEEATVEGTVKGLGDGFGNTKAFLVLEDCLVP
ncbi:MAG: OB-fold protein [Pyrinomonadaceae bacterium]